MLILPVLALLLFVLFYKRPVNRVVTWAPPPVEPPSASTGTQPSVPASLDFNDVFRPKQAPPRDPPSA